MPENALLSHDLIEGIHGRVGLVTDIVLYEEYPPHYFVYIRVARADGSAATGSCCPGCFPRVSRVGQRARFRMISPSLPGGKSWITCAAACFRRPCSLCLSPAGCGCPARRWCGRWRAADPRRACPHRPGVGLIQGVREILGGTSSTRSRTAWCAGFWRWFFFSMKRWSHSVELQPRSFDCLSPANASCSGRAMRIRCGVFAGGVTLAADAWTMLRQPVALAGLILGQSCRAARCRATPVRVAAFTRDRLLDQPPDPITRPRPFRR